MHASADNVLQNTNGSLGAPSPKPSSSPPFSPAATRDAYPQPPPSRGGTGALSPSLPHLSLPGQGVVALPSGSRRAHPMYVRHQAAREPYVPTLSPAPTARGTHSSLTGVFCSQSALCLL